MDFLCDPVVGELPAVGSDGCVLVARRTDAGRAYRWETGGDAAGLAAVLGDSCVAVGGQLYRRGAEGALFPMPVESPCVLVVPPAGDPYLLSPERFTREYAQVGAFRLADVRPLLDELAAEIQLSGDVGPSAVSEGGGGDDDGGSEPDVVAPAGVGAGSDTGGVPGEGGVTADSPASSPVKRGPGRPRKDASK